MGKTDILVNSASVAQVRTLEKNEMQENFHTINLQVNSNKVLPKKQRVRKIIPSVERENQPLS
jgi:hypothetical protein